MCNRRGSTPRRHVTSYSSTSRTNNQIDYVLNRSPWICQHKITDFGKSFSSFLFLLRFSASFTQANSHSNQASVTRWHNLVHQTCFPPDFKTVEHQHFVFQLNDSIILFRNRMNKQNFMSISPQVLLVQCIASKGVYPHNKFTGRAINKKYF